MADIAIFRINYKSDFILTLQSDAGWITPFCIKFWTGAPSQAYYAYYDGMSYTHCTPVEGEPTKLLVQFDDHHLPIGDLKFQIGYHFTVADFPTSIEDEVINQASVIIEVDDAPAQVMLDFNGETAPEIEFSLPAYANEAQRIANEQARIAAEEQRIANEQARISAEETRQANEQQRINAEAERVSDFASMKTESEAATAAANIAATLANEKAQLADDKAALAQAAATLANAKAQLAADKAALAQAAATLANEKAALAQQKAEYAQEQGDAAKTEAETAHALNEEVRDDEEARDQAEQIRQQQETARQQAESQRVTDFNAQMQQQQTAYADAEAVRDTAFDEAETERDAKVDAKVADITNMQAQLGYFVCDTGASVAAKTIAATGYALTTGGNIRIKMTNANTADAVTLNINNTGAKALFYNGTQASSTNSWEAGEVIEVYYDGTNYQASNTQGGIDDKSMQYKLLDVNWVKDHYVSASNTLVSQVNWWGALNVDVEGYDKIEAYVTALNTGKIVILDENMSILSTMVGTRPTIDLTQYPTAKYMSFTNTDAKNSMQIFGIKYLDTPISESLAKYKANIGDRNEVYPNATSDNIFVYPSINTTGFIDNKNNVNSGGRHTDYIVIPQKANYIYYSGKSVGTATSVVFYDSYKNYLSHVVNSVNTDAYNVEFAVPSNAVYARVSSMSKLLDFYFDEMPQIILHASSGKATIMRQINVEWTAGGYINTSNEVVSNSSYSYIHNFDISLYAGKKIIAKVGAYSGERNLVLDEDYGILYSGQGDLEVDLADYPTAKYISLSKYSYRNSGNVFVEEESEKTIEEIVAELYTAFGDSGAEYANEIVNEFYIEPVADINGYFLNNYNAPTELAGAKYSSKYYRIPPVATKAYYSGVSFGQIQSVLFFDKDKKYISSVVCGSNSSPVSNVEIPIPDGSVYIRCSSGSSICTVAYDKPTNKVGGGGSGSETTNLSNYLYRKVYYAIGDSFTYPIDEVIEEGPLAGFSMVYPYIIGNRNNMTVVNQARSGSTLRWYLTSSKYNDIAADVDYITIWYGINETAQSIPIGTVDEQPISITNDSTVCGCFNWFFKWLLINRPLAKVGVIITDYASEDIRQAIIGCCKRWGFAYLDIMGDTTIPMFTAGRDSDIQVDPEAISLRSQVFCKNYPGDLHPNYKMHQWQSTIIENFMRSL